MASGRTFTVFMIFHSIAIFTQIVGILSWQHESTSISINNHFHSNCVARSSHPKVLSGMVHGWLVVYRIHRNWTAAELVSHSQLQKLFKQVLSYPLKITNIMQMWDYFQDCLARPELMVKYWWHIGALVLQVITLLLKIWLGHPRLACMVPTGCFHVSKHCVAI